VLISSGEGGGFDVAFIKSLWPLVLTRTLFGVGFFTVAGDLSVSVGDLRDDFCGLGVAALAVVLFDNSRFFFHKHKKF